MANILKNSKKNIIGIQLEKEFPANGWIEKIFEHSKIIEYSNNKNFTNSLQKLL